MDYENEILGNFTLGELTDVAYRTARLNLVEALMLTDGDCGQEKVEKYLKLTVVLRGVSDQSGRPVSCETEAEQVI